MGTAKRERQRQNRSMRLAAAEAAAKKAGANRRIKHIVIMVVAAALLIASILFITSRTPSIDTTDTTASDTDASDDTASDTDASDDTASDTDASDDTASDDTASDTDALGCPALDGSSARKIDFDAPQPMCINANAQYAALFDTSEGEIRFNLHTAEVPLTVNNFITLARWGYYDDTLIFRTDPSIDIIQGGSPHTNNASDPGPGYTIEDEPDMGPGPGIKGPYRYQPGQLVMARTPEADSASAQFFITTGPNASHLDAQGVYVVFGTTDEAGLDVAQSIIGLHEQGDSLGGAPSREVTVHSVTIEEIDLEETANTP